MKVKSEKVYSKFLFLMIFLIFIFWISFSLLFINRVSFSVVTHQTKNIIQYDNKSIELFGDKIFLGEFSAKDNNLGLIIFQLVPHRKSESGKKEFVIFKFREKGKNKWSFQRGYNPRLFDSQSTFSFGIPLILDSKNKVYQFEIYSSETNKKDHISFKTDSFVTGYQYSKSEILDGNTGTINFIFNKFISSFSDIEFVSKSITYLIPIILVLTLLILIKKFLHKTRYYLQPKHVSLTNKYFKILILVLLVKLLFSDYLRIDIFFASIISWTVFVFLYRLKSNISFIFSFIIFMIWILIIPLHNQNLQNNLNVLSYAFLAFGVLQLIIEERLGGKR